MQATFGRLQQQSLSLSPGLNIIQAPNESGKSTWCAFLLAMAYGINSRERDKAGFIAEKNRYAPWNGSPMQGSLDCTHDGKDITLTRDTKRATAPMANFTATYTGTADPVGYLDGSTCGETLLGVSREVYERSAFIRQAGLSVGQTPELERRIASLITTGEEDSSYSQVMDTLKQQRNRRRHNKTGLLPQWEAEVATLTQQLDALTQLNSQYTNAQAAMAYGQEQLGLIEHQLAQWAAFEAYQTHQSLQLEKSAAQDAQKTADALAQQLQDKRVPENDVISQLRGAIVNLGSTRRQVDKAMEDKDNALRQAMTAESALGNSPFAGQTPEHAIQAANALPTAKKPAWALAPLLGIAVGVGVYFMTYHYIYSGAAAVATLALVWGLLGLQHKKAAKTAIDTYLKRHNVSTPEALTALATEYAALYQANNDAADSVTAAVARYNGLYETLSTNEQAISLEVRRFAPNAFDIAAADEALRDCATQRKALQVAQATAREAQLRWDVQAKGAGATSHQAVERPSQSKETLTAQLQQGQVALASAQQMADQLAGKRTALGDETALSATLAQRKDQIAQGELEYSALTAAMEALTTANTTLQNRFAPQLGKATAEIFAKLSQGRYDSVVLDRELHLSTQLDGDNLYRDIALLSAGAADQLYLATRLAICDLILPPDCPIVLDDALTNFDDARCTIALGYLQEVAKTRQVLLFTCQNREAQLCDDATAQTLG